MQDNRPLSALSYLSVFFAPFIVPILVFLISKDEEVRSHSKKALISHLIPFLSIVLVFLLIVGSFFTQNEAAIGGAAIIGIVGIMLVNIAVILYNIYKAIKLYV